MSDTSIRIKNLIGALGITDARFAELIGSTPACVSQIINGHRTPSTETLKRINSATGASIDYLLGITKGGGV